MKHVASFSLTNSQYAALTSALFEEIQNLKEAKDSVASDYGVDSEEHIKHLDSIADLEAADEIFRSAVIN